ncbi:MAG TPA: hypothetical protein VI756_17965, partial [Blastocatellia bacterium]
NRFRCPRLNGLRNDLSPEAVFDFQFSSYEASAGPFAAAVVGVKSQMTVRRSTGTETSQTTAVFALLVESFTREVKATNAKQISLVFKWLRLMIEWGTGVAG